MSERCNGYGRFFEEGLVDATKLQRIEEVLNSYFGFCKGRRTYNFRCQFIESLGYNFWKYFYVRGHKQSVRTRASEVFMEKAVN